MVSEGETIRVLKVRGTATLRQHLSEMGFVEGAKVRVVSRVNGDVVVSVRGSTFGIGRDMAMRIVTYWLHAGPPAPPAPPASNRNRLSIAADCVQPHARRAA